VTVFIIGLANGFIVVPDATLASVIVVRTVLFLSMQPFNTEYCQAGVKADDSMKKV